MIDKPSEYFLLTRTKKELEDLLVVHTANNTAYVELVKSYISDNSSIKYATFLGKAIKHNLIDKCIACFIAPCRCKTGHATRLSK